METSNKTKAKATGRLRSTRVLIALGALLLLAALPGFALAHGRYGALAKQPSFDSGSLSLVGAGGYATERSHTAIRVTVCLNKRYGGRFFNVRCNTDYDNDRRVKAQVGVPGCVRGVWTTTVVGQALARSGEWTHTASDTSAPFRCS